MRQASTLVMIVAGIAVARPAHAQPSSGTVGEAEQLFDDARKLLKDRRYSEACDKFARSYELGHVIGAELNLGDCAERDGHFAVAWHLFDAAAREWAEQGDDARARHARSSADRVATKLATIVVTIADPTVAGMTVKLGERDVPPAREIREFVEPADIEVIVTVPGRPPVRRTAHAQVGAVATIDVPASELTARAAASVGTGPERKPEPIAHPRSRVVPIALGGQALVLAGAALLVWRWSASTYDQSKLEFNGVAQDELFHSANFRYHLAQGLGVASVASAGVAVWLYVRGRGREPSAVVKTARVIITPILANDRTGLLLEGRY
jgi:hypothetical protein